MSCFTSAYVFNWSKIFTDVELKFPPTFDGRVILYPSFQNLKDYFSWRQVDCHINNLYNTTFWALVKIGGLTNEQAHYKLKGTFSKDKNEILHNQFDINYNFIEEVYKRGTIILKMMKEDKIKKGKKKEEVDIIKEIEEIKITDNDIQKEREKFISLTDKLLLSDEKYYELLNSYFQQDIYISQENLINDEFWEKYKLNIK